MPTIRIKKNHFTKILTLSFFLIFFFTLQSTSYSDNSDNKKAKSEVKQEKKNNLDDLYKEYKILSDKLIDFQKPVFEKSKILKTDRDNIQKLITKKWETISKINNVDIEKLKSLKSKLSNKDIDEKEKNTLMPQYRNEVMKFQKARSLTFNDKEVLDKQKEFGDKLKKLTIKANPETKKLYTKLDDLRAKIKELKK